MNAETAHTPACPLCKTPLSQPNRLGMSNTPYWCAHCELPQAAAPALTAEVFLNACRLLEPPPATRKIFVSSTITRQYRFPRSKKRRIRDKWFKQPRNHKPACYVTDHTVYIHPALHEQIQHHASLP